MARRAHPLNLRRHHQESGDADSAVSGQLRFPGPRRFGCRSLCVPLRFALLVLFELCLNSLGRPVIRLLVLAPRFEDFIIIRIFSLGFCVFLARLLDSGALSVSLSTGTAARFPRAVLRAR